jgi:hypothetical protein
MDECLGDDVMGGASDDVSMYQNPRYFLTVIAQKPRLAHDRMYLTNRAAQTTTSASDVTPLWQW